MENVRVKLILSVHTAHVKFPTQMDAKLSNEHVVTLFHGQLGRILHIFSSFDKDISRFSPSISSKFLLFKFVLSYITIGLQL